MDTPGAVDPDHRITFAVGDLIQSTSAVVDLMSGELLEVTGFYPNGAREHWLDASLENADAMPLEPVGFTGKEADEEVGLTYFGERYLIPRVGRWATPDPLSIHAMGGGEAGNSYHYVSGNLLQARDPLGLEGLAIGFSFGFRVGPINVGWSGGVFNIEDNGAYLAGTYTDTPKVQEPNLSAASVAMVGKDTQGGNKLSLFDLNLSLDVTITPSFADFKANSVVTGGGGGVLGHGGVDVAVPIGNVPGGTGRPTVTFHLGAGVGADLHAGINSLDPEVAFTHNDWNTRHPPPQPDTTAGQTFRVSPSEQFTVVPGAKPQSYEDYEHSTRPPASIARPYGPDPVDVGAAGQARSDIELAAPSYENHVEGQSIAPDEPSASAPPTSRCEPENGL